MFKLNENNVPSKNIFFMDRNKWFSLGILDFRLELLDHDVDNFALKFKINTVDKKGIYIVDTKDVNGIEAKDYDLYLIEANYKEEILEKHIKECSQEELVYLLRVPNTHLSWQQANTFLIENMGENSEFQYIHESFYNFEGDE